MDTSVLNKYKLIYKLDYIKTIGAYHTLLSNYELSKCSERVIELEQAPKIFDVDTKEYINTSDYGSNMLQISKVFKNGSILFTCSNRNDVPAVMLYTYNKYKLFLQPSRVLWTSKRHAAITHSGIVGEPILAHRLISDTGEMLRGTYLSLEQKDHAEELKLGTSGINGTLTITTEVSEEQRIKPSSKLFLTTDLYLIDSLQLDKNNELIRQKVRLITENGDDIDDISAVYYLNRYVINYYGAVYIEESASRNTNLFDLM